MAGYLRWTVMAPSSWKQRKGMGLHHYRSPGKSSHCRVSIPQLSMMPTVQKPKPVLLFYRRQRITASLEWFLRSTQWTQWRPCSQMSWTYAFPLSSTKKREIWLGFVLIQF
jgi:hypothetical protein